MSKTGVANFSSDEAWMARALKLAERGLNTTSPNPRVGCVLVNRGRVVGEGYHRRAGGPHAEVHALDAAGEQARGSTAYVTLEPCSHHGRTPPCAEALIKAGVSRVVCALTDPNPEVAGRGLALLAKAGIEVKSDVLAEAAEALNMGFLKRMRHGKPWMTLKMAASLDGATAMANGESQWITGPEARADVQAGRARSCAILTGIDTVLADDPSLNVRLQDDSRQPDRVVLDTRLRMSPKARMLSLPGITWVLHGPNVDQAAAEALLEAGAQLVEVSLDEGTRRLQLPAVTLWLGQVGFNEVWVEAGATLAGSLIAERCIDELWLYQAPVFMGSAVRPLLNLPLASLTQAIRWQPIDIRQVGDDLRWRLRPDKGAEA